jgi:hypothetical protein
VNSGAERADRANVRQSTGGYFVRLDVDSPDGHGPTGHTPIGREGLGGPGPPLKHRRRRGVRGRAVFLVIVAGGLGIWFSWAAQRPGGVSGTVNGWISHVRGDVAKISSDPDLAKARRYYNGQYQATGVYPRLSEADLAAVGVGVGVNVDWCNAQAVVIQGASGGGTVSRLLLSGKDLGEVIGKSTCPTDFADPFPWKAPKSK